MQAARSAYPNAIGKGQTPRHAPTQLLTPELARNVPVTSGHVRRCPTSPRKTGGRYAILDRRYRTKFGEIDIVASDAGTTVFVEVKTRVGEEFGGGAEALTAWKQRRVTQMAVDYLARHRLHDRPCRFDVVTIEMDDGRPRIQVYAHAFDATD